MYFSLIAPVEDRTSEAVHERLDGPYADHQWLWRWFPAKAGTQRGFLFRRHEAAGVPRFYVVSEREPQTQHGAWMAQTRDYAPQLSTGERLQFELRVNPTVRHGRDGKSKRHDVVMEAKKKLLTERGFAYWSEWQGDDKPELQQLIHGACNHWLARRGETMGFAVDADALVVESHLQHREKSNGELMFTSVDLAGQLTVTDPVPLLRALLSGIGRAKAFGCGLLLVRRPT